MWTHIYVPAFDFNLILLIRLSTTENQTILKTFSSSKCIWNLMLPKIHSTLQYTSQSFHLAIKRTKALGSQAKGDMLASRLEFIAGT